MASRVIIWASRLNPDEKPDFSPTQRSVALGPDGSFRFVGLAPGRYALMFSPSMGPGSAGYIVRRVPDVATGASDVVVRMTKGVVVKGRIVKEDGTPAAGVGGILTVRPTGAAALDFSDSKSVEIRADGTFQTEPLDPERTWDFEAPRVAGFAGGMLSGVKPGEAEVVLTFRRGASLRGRVLDEEGKPVGGIWVAAVAVEGANGSGATAQARAGEDGVFVLEGLGDYHFRVKTMGGEYQASTSEREFVPGEEAVVRVKKGFAISGRLVDAAGKGVKREAIFMTPEGGGLEGGADGFGVPVGDDGSFRFRGLARGRFLLWLQEGSVKIELGTFEAPVEGIEVPVPEEK